MEIHHVGINVADLEKALSFYKDVIGLEVIANKTFDSAIPGRGKVTCVFLERKSGGQMELIYEHARGGKKYGPGERSPHVCFMVDDLEARMEAMVRKGAKVIIPPSKTESNPNVNRLAFIEDPEGFRIEFWEMKK
jgi:catechol 2,3-dioxygenase-like lactoylglutathione lyase family enzyme